MAAIIRVMLCPLFKRNLRNDKLSQAPARVFHSKREIVENARTKSEQDNNNFEKFERRCSISFAYFNTICNVVFICSQRVFSKSKWQTSRLLKIKSSHISRNKDLSSLIVSQIFQKSLWFFQKLVELREMTVLSFFSTFISVLAPLFTILSVFVENCFLFIRIVPVHQN